MWKLVILVLLTMTLSFTPLFCAIVRSESQDDDLQEELLEAAEEGDVREIHEALEHGAKINFVDPEEGMTPLIAATVSGQTAAAELLIKKGADVNLGDLDNGAPPLQWAALIKPDKEMLEKGKTPPPVDRKVAVARLLLKSGADVNKKNAWGGTALQWAVDDGNYEVVALLLEAKADPNVADHDGLTPLIVAAHYEGQEFTKILKLLLSSGAKVNTARATGETALIAAASNNLETSNVQLLIQAGAKIDAVDNEGFSALMRASQKGRAAAMAVLIKAGCRLDQKTRAGLSALEVARAAGFKESIDLLVKAGAK